MARILLLLLIAFLIYMVIRALFRSQVKKDDAAPSEASSEKGEEMVACARCGVNVPKSDTRELDGRRICASNPNCK